MRVTEAMVYGQIERNTARAQTRLQKVSSPLMTGEKHARPSENPYYAQRVAELERSMNRSQQYRDTISNTMGHYKIVESSLTDMGNALTDLSTMAISMANDAIDPESRKIAAAEAKEILNSLKAMANAKHNGRYMFSGRKSDVAPYDDTMTFQGDSVGRSVKIADGHSVSSQITGPEIFGGGSTGDPSAFAAVEDLITALESNDTNGILNAMESIQGAHERVTMARSRVGYTLNELHRMDVAHEDRLVTLEMRHGEVKSVDIARSASEMAFAETVLQASVQTASKMSQMMNTASLLRL